MKLTLLLFYYLAGMQQLADMSFRFEIATPAFERNLGPTICFDEAHHNFHTADGRYAPFAILMRDDGYRIESNTAAFTRESLQGCDVLVIANPLSSENADWKKGFPHASALSKSEIDALYLWIEEGGSLLLIADHPPFSPAVAGLSVVLGATPMHTSTVAIPGETDVFHRSDGTLQQHLIVDGRTGEERVESVATFSGSAFYLSDKFQPLLVLGPNAYGITYIRENVPDVPRERLPKYNLSGWAQAGVRSLGRGRVAILGEASMCTAQRNEYGPFGFNHPEAGGNPQFCLNLVRWLSRVLKD